jgi:hypothetical protein
MKKLFTLITVFCALAASNISFAQSFTVHHDTVIVSGITISAENNITNPGSANDTLQWKIASTNFPADWMATLGLCDNVTCYGSADLWPTTIKESIYPSGTGDFHLTADLTSVATVGPYVLRVRLNNKYSTNDTAWQTYIITKGPVAVSPTVKNNAEVSIYPNPATNALNVVFDASMDVKNIAIYSIIGRQLNMFRVSGNNSANLNLENIPAGVYFVRLMNSRGDVVTTRKFTKQ